MPERGKSSRLTLYKHLHSCCTVRCTISHCDRFAANHEQSIYTLRRNIYPCTPPDMNGSVYYSLEHTQIAISANKEHYALVSDSESLHCQQTPICALRSPILSACTYPTCILALFSQSGRENMELGKVYVHSNDPQTSVDKISDFDFQKLNFYLEI